MRISLILVLLYPIFCYAGEADVLFAEVEHAGGNFYRFNVTVEHTDEDWEHYAKAWEVLDMQGKIIGARVLRHPHVNEQPFTRMLIVELPEDVDQVTIRAYDLIHQYGGKELILNINKGNNDDIE